MGTVWQRSANDNRWPFDYLCRVAKTVPMALRLVFPAVRATNLGRFLPADRPVGGAATLQTARRSGVLKATTLFSASIARSCR